ncbi:hypothetical protein SNE40_012540 [Patella caerulea]|uniref:Ig-like domain-containing protein n=1 Tax=Patella caerulea TaxID=87958 RepID=A0AAN8PW35_PATCE
MLITFSHTLALPMMFIVVGVQIIGANDIRRGSVIYIVCNVTILEGETEGVQWLKDDVRLDNIESNRISIKNSVTYNARVNDVITSRLSIKSADVSDSGYYMCQSSDGYQMAGIKVQILSGSHNTKRAGKMQEMKVVGSKSNGSLSRAFNSLPLLNYVYVLVLIFYTIL